MYIAIISFIPHLYPIYYNFIFIYHLLYLISSLNPLADTLIGI